MATSASSSIGTSTFRQATLNVVLEGLTPLLQHSPAGMKPATGEIKRGKKEIPTPEVEAETNSYRNNLGELVMPVVAINRCIVEAGKQFPDPQRPRMTLMRRMAAALYPGLSEWAVFMRDGEPITKYEIDIRRAVVQRNAIMRARPRIELPWSLEVSLCFDPTAIEPEQLMLVAETGGRFIGIGDYRPEKSGPYGRFSIGAWEVVE